MFIDRYSRLDSPIHRLSAGSKSAAGLAIIVVLIVLPTGIVLPVALTLLIALSTLLVLSRIPVMFALRRILLFEPFVLMVAALALVRPGGTERFIAIVARSTISLFTVILVANTTPFNRLLEILRRLHAPAIFITTLALMYRYVFVLVDEMHRIRTARASRTFRAGTARSWTVRAGVLGQLFVRSTERAERIYAAMSARGWR